jgi:hypothetical protein
LQVNLSDLRIGYSPHSYDLCALGDRGRFCYFAKKNNIKYEIADPSKTYDLVVVTSSGDLTIWSKYLKGNAKIIYDQVDSYQAVSNYDLRGILRGTGKYFSGKHYYLQLDYRKSIEDMSQRADAIVCATNEQKKDFQRYCKNVHVILDVHTSIIRDIKKDYSPGKPFNLVWEGLPENLRSFYEIRDVLNSINSHQEINLHILSNLEYYQYLKKYRKKNTLDICKKIFNRTFLYDWNELTASKIITTCDMALIPISVRESLAFAKPENKLLLFWRMGMPTIVAATPAYERVMKRANLDMSCQTDSEWHEKILKYMDDESLRHEVGEKGIAFTNEYCSAEQTVNLWSKAIQSVFV